MINYILKKIKGNNYNLDSSLSKSSKFVILINRLLMLIRGSFFKIFFLKTDGLLFLGKHVILRHVKKMKLGKNTTIGDNCYVNGLVKNQIIIGNNFSLGINSIIEGFGILSNLGESLIIGNNVGISPNSLISIRAPISIGDNTIIGPYFSLHPENHNFENNSIIIRNQGVSRKGISIGKNCWIGAKVTILDGVSIGDNSIIGAGSIVTKSFLENSIIAGTPAKLLRKRN